MPEPLLVAAGDAGIDLVIRPAAPLGEGDDTPGRIEILPGGQAANVAVWARTCQVPVHLVTSLGRDPLGDLVRTALAQHGVTVSAYRTLRTTRVASLVLPSTADARSLIADLSPGPLPALDHVAALRSLPVVRSARSGSRPDISAAAGIVYISGYTLLRPGSSHWIPKTVGWARRHGLAIAASPSAVSVVTRAGRDLWDLLASATDILMLNRLEATALTGDGAPESAARLLAEGTRLVLLTDGAAGAWLARRGRVIRVPPWHTPGRRAIRPRPEPLVDTTGAGDATAGVFLGHLLLGAPPARAARRAMRAGFMATRRIGAWPPPPQAEPPTL